MPRTIQPYADELLATNLALGKTVADAARAAGISERSAYRRLKQPGVRARVDEVRRAALDAASGRLHQGMVSACDRLTGLLGHANPHVQIRAAQTVIQMALKVRHEVDVADQLDELADQTRHRPVAPAVLDVGSQLVALAPDQTPAAPPSDRSCPVDLADLPRPPDQPISGDVADPPTETGPSPSGLAPAAGGDEAGAPGLVRGRSVARVGAVACVLMVLAGVSFAFAGAPRNRVEPGRAVDGVRRTCQNLTQPATAASSHDGPFEGQQRSRTASDRLTCFGFLPNSVPGSAAVPAASPPPQPGRPLAHGTREFARGPGASLSALSERDCRRGAGSI